MERNIESILNGIAQTVYDDAKEHGFYDVSQDLMSYIGVIFSEVAEVYDELTRQVLDFDNSQEAKERLAEEFADVIIATMSVSTHAGIDIGEAIMAKIVKNKTRSYLHRGEGKCEK